MPAFKDFPLSQREEIAHKYAIELRTMVELAKEYGTSAQLITRVLGQQGIEPRRSGTRLRFSAETEKEIVAKYESHSARALSKEYDCSDMLIRYLLQRHGVKLRSRAAAIRRLDPDAAKRVVQRYTTDESTTLYTLADEFGCSITAIRTALDVHNIGRRGKSSARILSKADDKNIARKYVWGASGCELAKEYGVNTNCIYSALGREGILIQPARQYTRRPRRELSLWTNYRLLYEDMGFLRSRQNGKCLWCQALLPEDPLDCFVDHIGGSETRAERDAVRGLCCGHACNSHAGRIEKTGAVPKDGLLRPFALHVLKVVASNHGHIEFPEQLNARQTTKRPRGAERQDSAPQTANIN